MTKRYSTILKLCGEPIIHPTDPAEWQKAVDENRVLTVMDAGYGLVGVRSVDTFCKLLFAKPLPEGLEKVIGINLG